MKKISLLIIVTLLCSFLASAAVDVRFIAPTPVVQDVPFNLNVEMNSNDDPVARIQFYVTSENENFQFLSSSRSGVWLQSSTINQNLAQSSGKIWKYNIGPKGTINEKTTDFKKVITLKAKSSLDDTIKLTDLDNIVAEYPSGAALPLTPVNLPIAPQPSICGDGVVGYFDDNTNGIKEATEAQEACDDANANAGDGCSANCAYVELGWDCTNKNFGNRLSVCNRIPAREFFLQKMTALINGECYPNAAHPAVMYCENQQGITQPDDNGKITTSQKVKLVVEMARALTEFFHEVLS